MGRRVRKTLNRIMVLFLSIIFVFGSTSIPGLSSFVQASENEAKISGFSLTVSEGALGLNIFFSGISDKMAENCTVVVDGASYQLTDKQDDGSYKISHFVNPQDISKKMPITLFSVTNKVALNNKNAADGVVNYSVKDYLDKVKNNNNETGRLAKAIDDYGTCAEYYFAGADQIPVTIADADFSEYKASMTGGVPDGVSYYGSSLLLSDTFAIRHYYTVTKIFDSYTSTFDGEPTEIMYDEAKGLFYYEISGIRAWDIVHPYDLTVTCGGVTGSIKYSVMSYAEAAKTTEPGSPLYTLVKSIYWYYKAFQDCLNQSHGGGEVTTDYVTYSMYGAKGDGKTNDYQAIVDTHAAANAAGLPVKADPGATYLITTMDKNNPKGALIKTDTDWTGAKFIIDDTKMTLAEKDCYLFTVAPSKPMEHRYCNPANTAGITLGLDAELPTYPISQSAPSYAKDFLNKTFPAGATQLQLRTLADGSKEYFGEKAMYFLETQVYKRWGRQHISSGGTLIPQREVIVVNEDGSIDPLSPVQFPWAGIYTIDKYYIDEEPLTITGGEFTTVQNILDSSTYIQRGISIQRSNVLMDGVEHYVIGEEKQFTSTSFYQIIKKDKQGNEIIAEEGYHARLGAPYQGFFRLSYCMNVTLRNCVFTNHLVVHNIKPGDEINSTSPYDYYAEYGVNLTIDHCSCARNMEFTNEYVAGLIGEGPKVSATYDEEGIMNTRRWGTTGTNYCKNLNVINHTSINRIDAHKGTYNLTVKDSTLGYKGIAAVGFGDLIVERTTVNADFFINLRRDFGSAWFGDVYITDCTWKLRDGNYAQGSPRLFFADYIPTAAYGYEPFTENGVTYYSALPKNIYINGLTIDASEVVSGNINNAGLQMFSSTVRCGEKEWEDETWFNDTSKYTFPLKAPEHIYLNSLKVIKNKKMNSNKLKVNIQNTDTTNNTHYFFVRSGTQLHYDEKNQTVVVVG